VPVDVVGEELPDLLLSSGQLHCRPLLVRGREIGSNVCSPEA
jgi:hypothetical protein